MVENTTWKGGDFQIFACHILVKACNLFKTMAEKNFAEPSNK